MKVLEWCTSGTRDRCTRVRNGALAVHQITERCTSEEWWMRASGARVGVVHENGARVGVMHEIAARVRVVHEMGARVCCALG